MQEFPLDIDCGAAIEEYCESSDNADDICWHLIKEEKYIEAFKINNWVGIAALASFTFEIIYLVK